MKIKKVFIIAEVGVNHNGDLKTALKLTDEAAKAKVDAIKFQTFTANNLVTKKAITANYQKKFTRFKSQYKMLKKLEFSKKMHDKCYARCKARKLKFLSSPFSIEDIVYLKKFRMEYYKIPSGEITNLPYLKFIAKQNKKIILSTGMSTLKEIKNAIKVLKKNNLSLKKITLLHCNSSYPTPYNDVNLKTIEYFKKKMKIEVGISDHSLGIEVPIAAVALGATIVEKHFTLNKNAKGPDHTTSIEPKDLAQMVKSIRNIEKSLKIKKKVTSSEFKNLKIVRKSIVAKKDIYKFEIFSKDNLTCKRPGIGISPMYFEKVIGLKAKKNFKKDDIIKI
tara:strand:+ start:1977 stop:2981 length:1005 start_codon:yes stop_codon:yes gene_type:complete